MLGSQKQSYRVSSKTPYTPTPGWMTSISNSVPVFTGPPTPYAVSGISLDSSGNIFTTGETIFPTKIGRAHV